MRLSGILLFFVGIASAGTANAQTEYVLDVPVTGELSDPYSPGHSGARDISGPHDLDGDGLYEVLVSDYSGGGRVHVIESAGVNTWELVYSTPVLDSTNSTLNIRAIGAGDTDGDGNGEIIFFGGRGYADSDAIGIYVFEYAGIDNDFGSAPTVIFDMGDNEPDRWRQEQIEVLDVDGDGRDEMLWANDGLNAVFDRWVINGVVGEIGSGFELLTTEIQLTSRDDELGLDPVNRGGGSPFSIVPGDYNGDGSRDFVLNSWNAMNFSVGTTTGPDSYLFPDSSATDVWIHASEGVEGAADDVAFFGGVAADVNGDGRDEAFFPISDLCDDCGTAAPPVGGSVSIVHFDESADMQSITSDNISFPGIGEGSFTSFGIAAGDVDGDGEVEIIGAGPAFTAEAREDGENPVWLRVAEFIGGDPADAANYEVNDVDVALDRDFDSFDQINRDSAGVTETIYDVGEEGAEFTTKIAFLGDADGDGLAEVAFALQGVDDSLYVYDEVWNADDSRYARTVSEVRANPDRIFMRIVSGGPLETAYEEDRIIVPSDYRLSANYPNPFNPATSFDFTLPLDKQVSVKIYDVNGRLVRTLVDNELRSAGTHTVSWNGLDAAGRSVASGNYVYTLEFGNFRQARNMVLLK